MIARPSDESSREVERDDIPRRRVWLIGGMAIVILVASVVIANAVRHAAAPGDAPTPVTPSRATDQIGIVEQTSIRDTRRGLDERAAQDETLRHFGWVDRAHGIARIPIDRAMDLVTDPAFTHRAFATDGGS